MRVAVVGGTGEFGLALGRQLTVAGHEVVIGSREATRAQAKASEIGVRGTTNHDAVRGVDLVVLAVRAEAALPTAESLAGAIDGSPVLSVASVLRFTRHGVFPGDDVLSLAEQTQAILHVPVVAGLHSLAATSLAQGKAVGDSMVCGDDAGAKDRALAIAGDLVTGRALDAGPLASARALEAMTAVIVNLNKRYRAHTGLRITGIS